MFPSIEKLQNQKNIAQIYKTKEKKLVPNKTSIQFVKIIYCEGSERKTTRIKQHKTTMCKEKTYLSLTKLKTKE